MQREEIIHKVLCDGFFTASCITKAPKRYVARIYKRLTVSLEKKVEQLQKTGLSNAGIARQLTKEVIEKYHSMEHGSIKSDGVSEMGDMSSNNSIQVVPANAFKDTTGHDVNTYEIHKEKAVSCLHEVNSNLKEELRRKEKSKQAAIKENVKLMANNRLLSYRSRELSKLKFDKYFRPRTGQLVDAANFSDFFGYVDRILAEAEVPIIEEMEFDEEEIITVTARHGVSKLNLRDGEIIVKKTIRQDLKIPKPTSNCCLLHETKVLSVIGKHSNIVSSLGIELSKEGTYSILLTYETNVTLKKMFTKLSDIDFYVAKHILIKLSDAIEHVHSKQVVHNGIIPENICLKFNSFVYEPVLVGFSCASRMCNSRPLTIYQQERFKEMVHLPTDVRQGLTAPSVSSDMYSFQWIIRKLMARSENENKGVLRKLIDALNMCQPKEHFKALVYHFFS